MAALSKEYVRCILRYIWVRRNYLLGIDGMVYYCGKIIIDIYNEKVLINSVKSAIGYNLWNRKLFFMEAVAWKLDI